MSLITARYLEQQARWQSNGRHIHAQFDDESIIVYQAYNAEIGRFAAANGFFGGTFKLDRMSWIKPNFLWMMYRSGWGTKPDQEVTLAIRLRRAAFDEILRQAVHSSYVPEVYESEERWKIALATSEVRLQWDPDHDLTGKPLARQAVQLGLRGETLAHYARQWIIAVEDISELVTQQRQLVQQQHYDEVMTPLEVLYPIGSEAITARV